MKKYLTLTLILLFLAPMLAHAQSSDKTQEIKETIGWLNQVGLKMVKNPNPSYIDEHFVTITIDENGHVIFKRTYLIDNGETEIYESWYKNLTTLGFYNSGKWVYTEWEDGNGNSTSFDFNSEKDGRRVLKAFSHLFTLLEDDFILDDRVVDKNKF